MFLSKFIPSISLKNVIKNPVVRVVIYVASLLFFVSILFTSVQFNPFRKIGLNDIRRFYNEGQYQKVITYMSKIDLQKSADKNMLLALAILSDVKIYGRTNDMKFLYDAVDRALKVVNTKLHVRMIENIFNAMKKNDDVKSSLIYYYIKNKQYIPKKLAYMLLRHIGNNKIYLNSLHAMISKVKCKHKVLYKLSRLYAAIDDYAKALKYLKVAKGIASDRKFLQRINNFLLFLRVHNKDCSATLKVLSNTKFSISKKRQYMYKFFCQDVLNILNINELRKFMRKNNISDDNSELFLLSKYFTIKLLFEDKDYMGIIKNLITVLNTADVHSSLIRKEDVVLYAMQKFYSPSVSNSYRRKISAVLLSNYGRLNPYFLLRMFQDYLIPNPRVFSYAQKKEVYSKIVEIVQNSEKEYIKVLGGLTSMYYVFTKSHYYLGNYQKAISFGNDYIKIKQLSDLNKIEIYRVLIMAYNKLHDYKSAVNTADEILTYYDSIYKIKLMFTKLKLQSLKNIDKATFVKNIEKNLKDPKVSFANPYYKYFFKEYLYVLLEKVKNIQYTKGVLSSLDKLMMYSAIYQEFYSESLKDINAQMLMIVANRSKLNNCSQLSYYFDTLASFMYVIFQNDLSEKLYKFAYCMLKKNKTKNIINVMQNAMTIDGLSDIDKFLVSAFLYLAHKKKNSQPQVIGKLFKSGKKIYKTLDEFSLNTFPDMPYNPRKMGALIYGK